jgi:hypothetical protein
MSGSSGGKPVGLTVSTLHRKSVDATHHHGQSPSNGIHTFNDDPPMDNNAVSARQVLSHTTSPSCPGLQTDKQTPVTGSQT